MMMDTQAMAEAWREDKQAWLDYEYLCEQEENYRKNRERREQEARSREVADTIRTQNIVREIMTEAGWR